MIIDIDHMSQKSMERTLQIAKELGINNRPVNYPLNIGHNGIRTTGGNERSVNVSIAQQVADLNGIFGIGTSYGEEDLYPGPEKLVRASEGVWNIFKEKGGIALGTDVNGMERLPKATPGLISSTFYNGFSKCRFSNANRVREWDYTKEHVAHYGLIPDFLQDVGRQTNGKSTINILFRGAEFFARMWEKCEQQKSNVR